MTTYAGKRNPNWCGGRSIASTGYVLVRMPGHPLADVRGYVYEHRLVAMQMLGRPLRKGEVVHHKNGNKTDNRPENLEVMESVASHRHAHTRKWLERRAPGQSNPKVTCKCGCGETFEKFDAHGRPRKFVTGHNIQPR